ncbi:hypothetical protein [Ferrovibrio sp.]|uniref:glycosyltransferase family 2 protein n=1 Tax=Ferrovibrio sp. TaxID=1917215 RepID=UPI0025B9D9A5|nr:hypothetical protein [Ferrovibrio sp.]MBX3455310.1 hypothetical protein [Ferrovibrio sp.]
MKRPSIFLATPCYGGLVHQQYMQSVIALMNYARERPFDVSLALLGNDSLITRSRNTLVSAFLDRQDATHLLFVDADISFQPQQVERLLGFGEDVVAGIYPLKVYDWAQGEQRQRGNDCHEGTAEAALRYCGMPFDGQQGEWRDGFATGPYAGTGFMMIRRGALERMIAAYPELAYGAMLVYPRQRVGRAQYALFDCMIDPETGHYLSEDYAFCRRWRKLGGQVWLDTESRLTHTGPHDFVGNPAIRFAGGLPAE